MRYYASPHTQLQYNAVNIRPVSLDLMGNIFSLEHKGSHSAWKSLCTERGMMMKKEKGNSATYLPLPGIICIYYASHIVHYRRQVPSQSRRMSAASFERHLLRYFITIIHHPRTLFLAKLMRSLRCNLITARLELGQMMSGVHNEQLYNAAV